MVSPSWLPRLSKPTTLILIRHGETEWNREGRIQGHTDSALTAAGIAQAEACAARLGDDHINHAIDQIIASDLGRTRHTAALLNSRLQQPIHVDARLRERSFGIAEGSTYSELDSQYPEMFSRLREVDPHYAIEGAESRAQFHQRVRESIHAIAAQHVGQRVLLVTHGGVLGAIYRWLNNLSIASPHKIDIPNVGYNRISTVGDEWRVEVWGDVSHLVNSAA